MTAEPAFDRGLPRRLADGFQTPQERAEADLRADIGVERGLHLAGLVRDYDRVLLGRWLRSVGRRDLEDIALALAAMVDPDRPVSELLGWTDGWDVRRSVKWCPDCGGYRPLGDFYADRTRQGGYGGRCADHVDARRGRPPRRSLRMASSSGTAVATVTGEGVRAAVVPANTEETP